MTFSTGAAPVFDLQKNRYNMLIGEACRGTQGIHSWYWNGYSLDNYQVFGQLFNTDGFNSFAFTVNDGQGSGNLAWYSNLNGWGYNAWGQMTLNLQTAETSACDATGEFLVGAMANQTMATQHPDWQARDASGGLISYMGPTMCANSPYWANHLIPIYKDFFKRYGNRVSSFILWEGPSASCWGNYCQSAFIQSGMSDDREWMHANSLQKWTELTQAIRSTGWTGKLIGGGWAAYEWEEKMWDSTLAGRQSIHYNIPELEAFKNGSIDMIMPELYIHVNNDVHAYRRSDAHYVYRSLMYERSLFGGNIIPNVELFWDGRTMTPDELFRWLHEVWCAGYSSYSVVGEAKLYFEHYTQDQDLLRLPQRNTFRVFNNAPRFGRSWPNFQFIVSQNLEKDLFLGNDSLTEKIAYGNSNWSAMTLNGTRYLTADKTGNPSYAPDLQFTVKPEAHTLEIVFLDNLNAQTKLWMDYYSGGSWQDAYLGAVALVNDQTTKTMTFNIPVSAIAASADANINKPGKQICVRFWNANGGWLSTPVTIRSMLVKDGSNRVVSRLIINDPSGPRYENAWDWYVKSLNRLFKQVDRTICGGALINEKETSLSDRDLYGIAPATMPRVLVIPRGASEPVVDSAANTKKIYVDAWNDLESRAGEIIDFIKGSAAHIVKDKPPLVYVNWNQTDSGDLFVTAINHAGTSGSVKIKLKQSNSRVHLILDSNPFGRNVSYQPLGGGWLQVDLAPYASITFQEIANSSVSRMAWSRY